MISEMIQSVNDQSAQQGYSVLRDQLKQYTGEYSADGCQITGYPAGFSLEPMPKLACFAGIKNLASCTVRELTPTELAMGVDLQRKSFDSLPNQPSTHKLHLKFDAVDTEEIKNLIVNIDGTSGLYKIGEGEANQYQIPNDKKLWESQLMIVCKDGKYYCRDLGVVHTSRIKIVDNTEVQIQQDTLVDLGKVVHYHFDKVTHSQTPTAESGVQFQILRPSATDYAVEDKEHDDPPTLRARPTWVSSDENKDLIQKEIILEANQAQNYFSIGRSMKREVQIKLKAVSADHCSISYTPEKGWAVGEKNKDKLSSNGTFVFMKSHAQMSNHEPSDLIPLQDGMVISFINYEIKVELSKKDSDVFAKEAETLKEQQAAFEATRGAAEMAGTMKADGHKAIDEPAATSATAVVAAGGAVEAEQQNAVGGGAPEAVPEPEPVAEPVKVEDKDEKQSEAVVEAVAEVKAEEPKADEGHTDQKVEEVAAEVKAEEPEAPAQAAEEPEGAKTPEKQEAASVAGSPRDVNAAAEVAAEIKEE